MNARLRDTLHHLSILLPGRVRLSQGQHEIQRGASVYVFGYWQHLCNFWLQERDQDTPGTGARLEYALREEIESRGWRWWTFRQADGQYGATVYRTGSEDDVLNADTPAHALALALLERLNEARP